MAAPPVEPVPVEPVPVDAVPVDADDGLVPFPDAGGGADPAGGAVVVVVVGVGPGVVARTALGGTDGGRPAPKAQPSTLPGGGW